MCVWGRLLCKLLFHSYRFILNCTLAVEAKDFVLTDWGRVTHICVSKLNIIGSDNGLSPGRRQAIIWTNAGILLIWTLRTNFIEISSEIHAFSFKKMHLKMSSAKGRLFSPGLNELKVMSNFKSFNNPITPVAQVLNPRWWKLIRSLYNFFANFSSLIWYNLLM